MAGKAEPGVTAGAGSADLGLEAAAGAGRADLGPEVTAGAGRAVLGPEVTAGASGADPGVAAGAGRAARGPGEPDGAGSADTGLGVTPGAGWAGAAAGAGPGRSGPSGWLGAAPLLGSTPAWWAAVGPSSSHGHRQAPGPARGCQSPGDAHSHLVLQTGSFRTHGASWQGDVPISPSAHVASGPCPSVRDEGQSWLTGSDLGDTMQDCAVLRGRVPRHVTAST